MGRSLRPPPQATPTEGKQRAASDFAGYSGFVAPIPLSLTVVSTSTACRGVKRTIQTLSTDDLKEGDATDFRFFSWVSTRR